MKKPCSRCKKVKPLDEFHRNNRVKRDGRQAVCKSCRSVERIAQRGRIQDKVFDGYGGACTCCGEDEKAFLVLDHVDNDGADHRRETTGSQGNGSAMIYRWAIKNGFPPRLQLLCANCNTAKMRGGCPHQIETPHM